MVIVIEYAKLRPSPWKNGGGVTREVIIEPATAVFPKEDFEWRLSCAEVSANGPFSNFPGFDRLLVVWRGEGLKLNQNNLLPFEVFRFQGEAEINSELLKDPIVDLGLIYKRGIYACDFKVLNYVKGQILQLDKNKKTILIFCVVGRLKLNQEIIDALTFARLNDESSCTIQSLEDSKFILMEIEKINLRAS